MQKMGNEKMMVKDILKTHHLYDENVTNWKFLMSSYEGTRSLIKLGLLERHERESLKNYERRIRELFGFGYSRSIVDLFNFYLFKKNVKREMAGLKNNELWNAFVKNCDLNGSTLDDFFVDQDKYASIYGHVGILVDRAGATFETKSEQKAAGVYPYLSSYFPPAILDWKFGRDEFRRPHLEYLKILDDDDRYLLWWPDKFEVYVLPAQEDIGARQDSLAIKECEGENPIGVIPFVWLYNLRDRKKPLGVSSIEEVSRIDLSIMRNLSDGEEIITYASFPMMRKPMREARPDGVAPSMASDDVGASAILEFDPEHPESKPDWLPAEVAAPLEAITGWVERKVSEIYRATNAGGMASMEVGTAVKSGVALQAEFQLLNATLVRRAKGLESAESKIIYYWLLWESLEDQFTEVSIERSRTYDIENLAADLENALTASTVIMSKKFKAAVQKQLARQMLPSLSDDQISDIDEEIDNYSVPIGYDPPES